MLAFPIALPAALLLAGCTDGAPPAPEPVDPDDALRAAAAGRERELLLAYDGVLAAQPTLAGRLQPLREHHAEHLAALVGPSPTTEVSPSPSAPPTVAAQDDPAAALRTLVTAERAAGAAHAQDCLAASRKLAAVLASLSASELSHPVALA